MNKASKAAHKAWATMKAREAKMSPAELKALHSKRIRAAKKAWKTMRSLSATSFIEWVEKCYGKAHPEVLKLAKSYDGDFDAQIRKLRPDWFSSSDKKAFESEQQALYREGKLPPGQVTILKAKGVQLDKGHEASKKFSVFHPNGGQCGDTPEKVIEVRITDPRKAAEKAAKVIASRGVEFAVDQKKEICATARMDSGEVKVSYFFVKDSREDMLIVLEGSFTEDEADKITEKEFSQSSDSRLAALKAWKTMRKQEAKMSPAQLKALHLKRSQAAKKAWKTMRAKAA